MKTKLDEIGVNIKFLESKETLSEEESKELDRLYLQEEKELERKEKIYKRSRGLD